MNTNKPFGSLGTIEVVELTREEIDAYSKTVGEEVVLKEISECRKRLDDMGISYRK